MPLFQRWIAELDSCGYENFWQIMNAKDFGIPQNRKRVFMVSILRDNIEPYPAYEFPKSFPLELRLKDMLEENVDEKYYLSDKMITNILSDSGTFVHKEPSTPPHNGIASTLTARMAKMGRHDNYIKDNG